MSNTKVKDYDYLFLSTMLRAREAKMLSREKISRMLDAPSFAESAKQLTECGFEDMSGMSAQQIENALCQRRAGVYRELERLMPEKEILAAFRLKYDYHNAKVLVKSEGADVDGAYLLSQAGNVPAAQLTEAFHSDDYRFIPQELGQALAQARSILRRTENPQLADFALDKAYFAQMLQLARGLSTAFLGDYVKLAIDAANLSAIVRTKRMGRDYEFLRPALIPDGGMDAFSAARSVLSGDSIAPLLSGTSLERAGQLGDEAANGGDIKAFEIACDEAVGRYFGDAKYASFGPQAVIAYLDAMEKEISAARMVLTGKLAGTDPQLIRERLCDVNA